MKLYIMIRSFFEGEDKPDRNVYIGYGLTVIFFLITLPFTINLIEAVFIEGSNEENFVFALLLSVLYIHVLILLLPFHLLVIYKRLNRIGVKWAIGMLPFGGIIIYPLNQHIIGIMVFILTIVLGFLPDQFFNSKN